MKPTMVSMKCVKEVSFFARFTIVEMNPKALQYIMGHFNITMTLYYYAHATSKCGNAEVGCI